MEDHWFDALNKVLIRDAPRRMLVQVAGIAITSRVLGAVTGTDAAKNGKGTGKEKGKGKGKGKRKGKNKGKGGPNQPTDWSRTCSRGACFLAWPSKSRYDQENRNYCEFICGQCDGDDPRQFCILGDPNNPLGAACCDAGLTCCGNECVQFGTPDHCTGCDKPCRGDGMKCCHSSSVYFDCADTSSTRSHCGDCDRPCLDPDRACCEGSCQDTQFNNAHCGGCDPCPVGWECCHGRCIDPQHALCCPDHPSFRGVCNRPARCCTLANGNAGCCSLP